MKLRLAYGVCNVYIIDSFNHSNYLSCGYWPARIKGLMQEKLSSGDPSSNFVLLLKIAGYLSHSIAPKQQFNVHKVCVTWMMEPLCWNQKQRTFAWLSVKSYYMQKEIPT